jgi:hypothetical protein
MLRIDHPETQHGPVSLTRWLKYHIGVRLARIGMKWEDEALFPQRCPDCGAAMRGSAECDHVPF